jgi:cytochrome c oxidase assembly factor CtaG
VVIGIDPTPRPIPPVAKLGMVCASLALHAIFGVVMMSTNTVLGAAFYRSLHLSWHTDLLADQRLGGAMAWAGGEIPLGVVIIALLIQWRRSDQRTAKRLDRAADRGEDSELAAYNAMLAELSRRDSGSPSQRG